MNYPFIKLRKINNQNGQSTLAMALLYTSLLAVSGLAIDSSYIFLQKARVQRMLDAAAVAGITNSFTKPKSTVESETQSLARHSLELIGIRPEDIKDIKATLTTVPSAGNQMELTSHITLRTILLSLIPGLGTIDIQPFSKASRMPLVLSMVLDRSGSMTGSKFASLKTASKSFVNTLQENIDQLAIITFDHQDKIERPMSTLTSKKDVATLIDGLKTGNGTNIAGALALGLKEIERVAPGANSGAFRAILLFSDGAPSATHARYLNRREKPPKGSPLPENPPGSGYYDYFVDFDEPSDIFRFNPDFVASPCGSLAGCLQNFEYLDAKGKRHGANITNLSNDSVDVVKEYYHQSIIESDYAKDIGIPIYVIALGKPYAEGSDPYQGALLHSHIKTYLMRRIANTMKPTDPPFPNLPANPSHPAGLMLITQDAKELEKLFLKVARFIKVRLTA